MLTHGRDTVAFASLSRSEVQDRLAGFGDTRLRGSLNELMGLLRPYEAHLLALDGRLGNGTRISSLRAGELRALLVDHDAPSDGFKPVLFERVMGLFVGWTGVLTMAPKEPLTPTAKALALAPPVVAAAPDGQPGLAAPGGQPPVVAPVAAAQGVQPQLPPPTAADVVAAAALAASAAAALVAQASADSALAATREVTRQILLEFPFLSKLLAGLPAEKVDERFLRQLAMAFGVPSNDAMPVEFVLGLAERACCFMPLEYLQSFGGPPALTVGVFWSKLGRAASAAVDEAQAEKLRASQIVAASGKSGQASMVGQDLHVTGVMKTSRQVHLLEQISLAVGSDPVGIAKLAELRPAIFAQVVLAPGASAPCPPAVKNFVRHVNVAAISGKLMNPTLQLLVDHQDSCQQWIVQQLLGTSYSRSRCNLMVASAARALLTNSLKDVQGSSLVWQFARDSSHLLAELQSTGLVGPQSKGLIPISGLERSVFDATVGSVYDKTNSGDVGGLKKFSLLIGRLYFLGVPEDKVLLLEDRLLCELDQATLSAARGMPVGVSLELWSDPEDFLTSGGSLSPTSAFSLASFNDVKDLLRGSEIRDALDLVAPSASQKTLSGVMDSSLGKRLVPGVDLSFEFFSDSARTINGSTGFNCLIDAWKGLAKGGEDVSNYCVSGMLFDRECQSRQGGRCHREHGTLLPAEVRIPILLEAYANTNRGRKKKGTKS